MIYKLGSAVLCILFSSLWSLDPSESSKILVNHPDAVGIPHSLYLYVKNPTIRNRDRKLKI